MAPSTKNKYQKFFCKILGVTLLYFLTGEIGILFAIPPGLATAVWPPSGIATAAVILCGYRVWPGIFLGSLLVNMGILLDTTSLHQTLLAMATTSAIAMGSALEACLIGVLTQKILKTNNPFTVSTDAFRFFVIIGVSSITASTIGTFSLFLTRLIGPEMFFQTWATWWLGDVVGILIFTPLLIAFRLANESIWKDVSIQEMIINLALLIIACHIGFGNLFSTTSSRFPLNFLPLPFLVWASFRFKLRIAFSFNLLVAILAVYRGPKELHESLFMLQFYLGVLATTVCLIAANVFHLKKIETELVSLNEKLEEKVNHRTEQLYILNQELRKEVVEKIEQMKLVQQSERKLNLITNQLPAAIWTTDEKLVVTSVREGKLSAFHLKGGKMVGLSLFDYFDKNSDTGSLAITGHEMALAGQPAKFEVEIKERIYEVQIEPFLEEGRIIGTVGISWDTTERHQLEKEVLEISHREQQRIGQDLHDDLGQQLTGIAFLGKVLEQKLALKNLEELKDVQEIEKLIYHSITKVRNLARGLFPVDLYSKNLTDAFEELAATTEKIFQVTCIFECNEALFFENEVNSVHLYRFAQEAIHNAIKHGQAENIWIHLETNGDKVTLSIHDDGIGYSLKKEKANGLGLKIMNYRVRMMQAKLHIQSREKKGTIVTCSLDKTKLTGKGGGKNDDNALRQ